MATLDDWKAAFPELVSQVDGDDGYTDAQIERAIEEVEMLYPPDDAARRYAVAHWLSYEGPGGEATSVSSSAGLTETKRPVSATPDDAFWATTTYGVKFLSLSRRLNAFTARSL